MYCVSSHCIEISPGCIYCPNSYLEPWTILLSMNSAPTASCTLISVIWKFFGRLGKWTFATPTGCWQGLVILAINQMCEIHLPNGPRSFCCKSSPRRKISWIANNVQYMHIMSMSSFGTIWATSTFWSGLRGIGRTDVAAFTIFDGNWWNRNLDASPQVSSSQECVLEEDSQHHLIHNEISIDQIRFLGKVA